MIVVSDTTALTTLLNSGLDWVSPRLFPTVLIPPAVAHELLAFHAELPAWCVVRGVAETPLLARLRLLVDAGEAGEAGEAEAITLAVTVHADAVLLDDKKGRRQAEALGLTCLALPAVLVAAKRASLIPSVAGAFNAIAIHGRYRIAEAAAMVLLRSVGEA